MLLSQIQMKIQPEGHRIKHRMAATAKAGVDVPYLLPFSLLYALHIDQKRTSHFKDDIYSSVGNLVQISICIYFKIMYLPLMLILHTVKNDLGFDCYLGFCFWGCFNLL